MASVITDACIKCKHTICVTVCAFDAFHEGINSLVINQEGCGDMGECQEVCPINAISWNDAPNMEKWAKLNHKYAQIWPNITMQKPPLPEAEEFAEVKDKFEKYFDPEPGEGD